MSAVEVLEPGAADVVLAEPFDVLTLDDGDLCHLFDPGAWSTLQDARDAAGIASIPTLCGDDSARGLPAVMGANPNGAVCPSCGCTRCPDCRTAWLFGKGHPTHL